MRKVLFWIHLAAGVIAGAVILVMSVTGALLALQPQALRFVERGSRRVEPPVPLPERLGPEALIARALAARPDLRPSSVTLDADPRTAALLSLGREGSLYLDPYTGAITGQGAPRTRAFFRGVTDWHRWLAAEGDARAAGKAVTGACNAAFWFLSMSGIYLWWPRQWTWRHVRPILAFQGGLAGRARDFNWHNVIGLWCAPVIFFLTLTALMISYPAVGNALYDPQARAGGPPRPEGGARGEGRAEAPLTPASFTGADGAWAAARERVPEWTLGVVRLGRPGAPVTVTVTDSAWRSPYGRSQLTFDARDGGVTKWEPFGEYPWRRRARVAARWIHTGEILGLPGQLVAGVASFGGAVLVWTGIALALRRFRAWRRAPSSVAAVAAEEPRSAEPA